METYWESYTKEFDDLLPGVDLIIILESFWYFCKGNKSKAKKILDNFHAQWE